MSRQVAQRHVLHVQCTVHETSPLQRGAGVTLSGRDHSPMQTYKRTARHYVRRSWCFTVVWWWLLHWLWTLYAQSINQSITLTHLVFSNISTGFLLSNAYDSNLLRWPTTLSAPLSLLSLHSLHHYHTPTRGLRSANNNLLSAPRVRTTFASRGFSVAAPAVWNSLPCGIRDASSTHTFRRFLKTHCFQQAFGSP